MQSGKSLKDQGKSRTGKIDSIQARSAKSQSLKDQGKSRTTGNSARPAGQGRNPLKIRASLGQGEWRAVEKDRSQSLKDQGKSRTRTRLYHPHPSSAVAIP